MATKTKLENFEETFHRKLTAADAYANRPRNWMLYTVIVLIIVLLVGWSSSDIQFTGLTVTGTEVAKGVINGVFSPDTELLFGTGEKSCRDRRPDGPFQPTKTHKKSGRFYAYRLNYFLIRKDL